MMTVMLLLFLLLLLGSVKVGQDLALLDDRGLRDERRGGRINLEFDVTKTHLKTGREKLVLKGAGKRENRVHELERATFEHSDRPDAMTNAESGIFRRSFAKSNYLECIPSYP